MSGKDFQSYTQEPDSITETGSQLKIPSPISGFKFPKASRLLNASDFSPIFDNPPFRGSDRYCLILAKPNNRGYARLGLVVAKKNLRLAVDRNRFKRIVRESFRLKHQQLPPIDAIVLARRGADKIPNLKLHKMLDKLWKRVAKQAAENKKSEQS